MGKLHRSQRTVSIGNPDALKQMWNSCKCSVTAQMYRKLQIEENVSISPAFICPPLLDVADVIDRAVNSHVIVVTSNVEGTTEFNGPLLSKKSQKRPYYWLSSEAV